ncbi:MAG TPA: hypothetical protein VHN37_03090 [Actinomycetota bacterium]|nr:hypothetical protein [Actinomycetota bacterium]
MYSAKTAADAGRRADRRDIDDKRRERAGRALAFTGAVVDASTYGGTFATLQREGLRRRLVTPRAEEELRLVTWRELSGAASAAARALQHIRYADDDFLSQAEELFRATLEIVQDAASGEVEAVEAKSELIGSKARDLERIVKQQDPRSLVGG